jgi:hypothetical protein
LYFAEFWRLVAIKFRDRSGTIKDPELYEELLELGAVCEEVAGELEDRATSG